MSRLTRDGMAEPVSRDRILWRERVQGKMFSLFSDHEQGCQPYLRGRVEVDQSITVETHKNWSMVKP